MIENLQNEFYQLENKQAKGAKRRANIRSWRAKNAQNFLQSTWKAEYEKSSNVWIIYWW